MLLGGVVMAFDPYAFDIVVTNACADAAAELFGLGGREAARAWVVQVISTKGEIVDKLPPVFGRRRSPSGWFLLAEGLLLLPLASGADRTGTPQWIATHCVGLPRDHEVDPFRLGSRELLDHVSFAAHAIERFQLRGGGHPDSVLARQQLAEVLAPSVYASPKPPAWWRSAQPAEFYLLAGSRDEFCLPCRTGDGVRPFTATTFMHQAADLFVLPPGELGSRCRLDPSRFPPGGRAERRATRLLDRGGQLIWHKPGFAPAQVWAKWWLVFADRVAAPVIWEPENARHPLLVLGLVDARPWWRRLLS